MDSDWLFDGTETENDWRMVAEHAGDALAVARQALERVDPDDPSGRDRRAMEQALSALADVRRSLLELDRATLVDAESVVREILDRSRRPAALVAQQA